MSVFSSDASWGGNCQSPHQSPINLSQSFAKPCDLLCHLVIDEGYKTSANVIVSDEGLILQNMAGLGSCKFNEEGYTCNLVLINHPSHHTIEGIQADAEVMAIFRKPTGQILIVSSLVRVHPNQTNSSQFFNSFVRYADPTSNNKEIPLGNNWSLSFIVPPSSEYFVYDGSNVVPGCERAKWVVFKSMINIDPNDFAVLVNKVQAGSRAVQPLGDRNVYFNENKQLPGGPMPKDGRAYIVFHQDLSESFTNKTSSSSTNKNTVSQGVSDWVVGQVQANGVIAIFDIVLLSISFVVAVYYGIIQYKMFDQILYISKKAGEFGSYLRGLVIKPKPAPIPESDTI